MDAIPENQEIKEDKERNLRDNLGKEDVDLLRIHRDDLLQEIGNRADQDRREKDIDKLEDVEFALPYLLL